MRFPFTFSVTFRKAILTEHPLMAASGKYYKVSFGIAKTRAFLPDLVIPVPLFKTKRVDCYKVEITVLTFRRETVFPKSLKSFLKNIFSLNLLKILKSTCELLRILVYK